MSLLIGVMADSHGNRDGVLTALDIFRKRGISVIAHAGDFGSPEGLLNFQGFVLHLVCGNNDSLDELIFYAEKFGQPKPAVTRLLSFKGREVFLCHGDRWGYIREAMEAGYDYIIRGHSHYTEDYRVKETRILNPGAIHRTPRPSVGVLDVEQDKWEVIYIREQP